MSCEPTDSQGITTWGGRTMRWAMTRDGIEMRPEGEPRGWWNLKRSIPEEHRKAIEGGLISDLADAYAEAATDSPEECAVVGEAFARLASVLPAPPKEGEGVDRFWWAIEDSLWELSRRGDGLGYDPRPNFAREEDQ